MAFMKKVRQLRLISAVLIVAFLATSTLARAVSFENVGDLHSTSFLHTKSDAGCSSDHQYPFEEKEKEFEDKSETDDKVGFLSSNFFFICELRIEENPANDIADYGRGSSPISAQQIPLFVSHCTFLI